MKAINSPLQIAMNMAKVQALLARQFDRLSIHGISFNDLMICYLLEQSATGKMRRIDLADQIGLTASGITRLLLPLEKIGLVAREANERDARVSYVTLTATGRQLLGDALATANALALEIIPAGKEKEFQSLSSLLYQLGGNIA